MDSGKESFCKLVPGTETLHEITDNNTVCDTCYSPRRLGDDDVDATKVHSPSSAVDGDNSTWWQSPPISRGQRYNRVDLEIDLLQRFEVSYFAMSMADSPRPGVWALEKSKDFGLTWTPWQYFAPNDAACLKYFGVNADASITEDDTVICTIQFSKITPFKGGEVIVPLTKGRPSEDNTQNSEKMMDWLEATNVRVRLMQTNTMLGHLMSAAQGNNTVTQRFKRIYRVFF